jgi:L-glyceraldehyde reductase
LEKFVEAGKIRSIGISNFTIQATKDLLKTAKIPPAVNQIEAHPYLLQPELFKYLKDSVSDLSMNISQAIHYYHNELDT